MRKIKEIVTKNWKHIKETFQFCLLTLGMGGFIYWGIDAINRASIKEHSYHVHQDRIQLAYQGAKDRLVCEVDKYIQSVAPGSCVNGIVFVDKCLEYDVDIKFALVQAHCESHFGTKGVAAKTNSIFNVCAFDGMSAAKILKNGHGYTHPDHSIEPYLKLLTTRYLVDGKTEMDMLDKFVDVGGHRYASNPKYEDQLLSAYEKVDSISNISQTLNEYKRYKIIIGE